MQRCESTHVFEIRAKNIVFTEKEIPSEFAHTLASRIWFVNKDRSVNTSEAVESRNKPMKSPSGLMVYEPLPCHDRSSLDKVIADLGRLFRYHDRNPKAIEFTTRGAGIKALFTFRNTELVGPNYGRVLDALHEHQPCLSRYIEESIAAFVKPELLGTVNIEVMQYQPNSNFKSHIDNVVQTGDEPWPVYAIHIGRKTKRFDLLPVFDRESPAIRILVEPGQTVLLDGAARLQYSHSVPAARERAYTIRFHFLPVSRERVGYNDVLKTAICLCGAERFKNIKACKIDERETI